MTSDGSNTTTWDRNGNLTSNGTDVYNYDSQNRLLRVEHDGEIIQMAYDGADRRVTRAVNGGQTSTFAYDEHGPLARVAKEAAGQRSSMYGLDGQILWDATSDQG